eukprot:Skav227905  [mRNA]  locus=scaffold146:48742:58424:- [translate_table: standard]
MVENGFYDRVPLLTDHNQVGVPQFEPPSLWNLPSGGRVSLKADIIVHQTHAYRCRTVIHGKGFVLDCPHSIPAARVSILNSRVMHDHRGTILQTDGQSQVLALQPVSADSLFRVKELCAGITGLSTGGHFCGFATTAAVEQQAAFCQLLRDMGHTTVVEGDIGELQTLALLHQAAPTNDGLAMGFSCQPFSTGGDRKGGSDVRSHTLGYGLWYAYMLDCPFVILECVSQAPSDKYVKQCLHAFQVATNFVLSEIILHLQSLWPSQRTRWWCVLTHPLIGKVQLHPLPSLPQPPQVSDLFPCFPELPDSVLQQVALTAQELQILDRIGADLTRCEAQLHQSMPTALHSWANQLVACACGCRSSGLSTDRMLSRGFFGTVIAFPTPEGKRYRHPAPKELSILVGMPCQFPHHPARLLVAGLGQIASPLQSSWILGALKDHVLHYGLGGRKREPLRAGLGRLCTRLFAMRDMIFPKETHTLAMQEFERQIKSMLLVMPPSSQDPPASDTTPTGRAPSDVSPVEPRRLQPLLDAAFPGAVPGFTLASGPADSPPGPLSDEWVPPDNGGVTVDIVGADGTVLRTDTYEPTDSAMSDADETIVPQMLAIEDVQARHEEVGSRAVATAASNPSQVLCTGAVADGVAPVFAPGTCIRPEALIAKEVVIYYADLRVATTCKVQPSSIIRDLVAADRALCPNRLKPNSELVPFSIVGQRLVLSDLIDNWQCIIMYHADTAPDEAQEFSPFLSSFLPRQESLLIQGAAVGHDEMAFYLRSIAGASTVKAIQPLVLNHCRDRNLLLDFWIAEFLEAHRCTELVSAVLHEGHWNPVMVIRTLDDRGQVCLTLRTTEQFAVLLHPAHSPFPLQVEVSNQADRLAADAAAAWRFQFWQALITSGRGLQVGEVALGGHPEQLVFAVATLLHEHGVAKDQATGRSKEVLSALGVETVKLAMGSKRPWHQLKAAANDHRPMLKLIKPDELNSVIKERAKQGKSYGRSTNKQTDGAGLKMQVSPGDLRIPPGVFVLPNHEPAHQIGLHQMRNVGKGIVVCSEEDVGPYLNTAAITSDALAFVVVNPTAALVASHGPLQHIPAQCISTGEPILISAILIQMGGQKVTRNIPEAIPQVSEVPVTTVKLFLYQDQVTEDWSEVSRAPIKHALSLLPMLTVCKAAGCKCPSWHRPADTDDPVQTTEPLLDVWNKDFLSSNFRKCKAGEAFVFCCAARIRSDKLKEVCGLSGQNGLYVEVRTNDGRNVHEGYQTVWLNKMTYSDAVAASHRSCSPTWLVRVGRRFGLKVANEHAPGVHQQFRQEAPYVNPGTSQVYQLSPLPWGTSRQSLLKLFKLWQWPAVPTQPAGRAASGDGIIWLAKASSPPLASVVTLAQENSTPYDIIIVPRVVEPPKTPAVPTIEASSWTRSRLHQPLDGLTDPWAEAAKQLPSRQTQEKMVSQSQLDQLEAKLTAQLSKPQDADVPMDLDDHPTIRSLETRLDQLTQAQHVQAQQTQSIRQQLDQQSTAIQNHMDRVAAVSETHLTGEGARRFRGELRHHCPGARFSYGTPAEPRGASRYSTGGKSTGVGFISSFPTRPIPGSWPEVTGHAVRRHAAHFLVDDTWVSGGVLYGPSFHSDRPEVKELTNQLLTEVVQVVEPQRGPRFIAGDFNQVSLPIMDWLETKGWTDLQSLALHRWGISPQPTCKATSRKDFLLLCPRLQACVQTIRVDQDPFPDHAVLSAWCSRLGTPESIPRWIKPAKIVLRSEACQWLVHSSPTAAPSSVDREGPCLMTAGVRPGCTGDSESAQEITSETQATELYGALWRDWEDRVHHTLQQHHQPGLTQHQRGRGITVRRTFHVPRTCPIKPSRHGEPALDSSCPTLQLKRWHQQWRRLLNLTRVLRIDDPGFSVRQHRLALWTAILKAKGFPAGFVQWWSSRPVQTMDDPSSVPFELPTHEVALAIMQSVSANVKHLDKQLVHQRTQEIKAQYKTETNKIFQDLRMPGAQPVETLLDVAEVTVVDVPDDSSIILDGPSPFRMDQVVYGDQVPLRILIQDVDQIWFTQSHSLLPGMRVTQRTPVGTTKEIFDRFAVEWLKRWDKHRDVADDRWDHILGFIRVAFTPRHMPVFTRMKTNSSVIEKCEALQPVWIRMGRSFAPRAHKLRALKVKAWPSALHSSSIASIPDQVLDRLRAGCMRGLRLHKPGLNAGAYLGLYLHPSHDPEFHMISHAATMFRRYTAPELAESTLPQVACQPARDRLPGPIGLMATRLEMLGWTYHHGTIWVDHWGCSVDLLHAPTQDLQMRLIDGFQCKQFQQLSSRLGFEGCENAHAGMTHRALANLDDEAAGAMRTLLIGGFVTGDQLGRAHRTDESQWTCKFCNEPDSLRHRHWECSHTEFSRNKLTLFAKSWALQQPNCTKLRGWVCLPESVRRFRTALSSHHVLHRTWPREAAHTWYIFTDGAAKFPKDPLVRLTGWAWAYALGPCQYEWMPGALGSVPGALQTVQRGELAAMIDACSFGFATGANLVLFCDNWNVVRRVQKLLHGQEVVSTLLADHDLWSQLQRMLLGRSQQFQIVHVYSHQTLGSLHGLEHWVCQGNQYVDKLAAASFDFFDSDFMDLHTQAAQDHSRALRFHHELIQHFVRVSDLSMKTSVEYPQQVEGEDCTAISPLDLKAISAAAEHGLPVAMAWDGLADMLQWMQTLQDEQASTRWVSWMELLVHFQSQTGKLGVQCHGSGQKRLWKEVRSTQDVSFRKLAVSFGQFCTNLVRHHDPEWRAVQRRPSSHRVRMWMNSIPVKLAGHVRRVIDSWFDTHDVWISKSADLDQIHVAV